MVGQVFRKHESDLLHVCLVIDRGSSFSKSSDIKSSYSINKSNTVASRWCSFESKETSLICMI